MLFFFFYFLFLLNSLNGFVLIYVGTYTGDNENESKGIYAFLFDSHNLSLKSLGLVANTRNPTYLLVHPSEKYVLAINELDQGKINSFEIDSMKTGQLNLISQQSSYGNYPIYISSSKLGEYIFVANYMSGTIATFPFENETGKIQSSTSVYQQNGSSIDLESQTSSHPHCVLLDKKEENLISADLGSDELYVYQFKPNDGTLQKLYITKAIKPGDGPRHLIFSVDGTYVYVINELTSSITVFKYSNSTLKFIQSISTLPTNYKSINYAAELVIHPLSGKFLYASNRGHDSIVVYQIDVDTGLLTAIQHIHVKGRTPRHFNILPNGQYLIVANQDSNNLVVFQIDQTTGKLFNTELSAHVNKPTCVKFLKYRQ